PDPERLVSSRHCTILNRDGVYYLTDTSTNGVLLVNAGHRLRRGNSEPLQDGETVRLGEYDILVQLGHDIALPGSGNPQTDPFTSFDALMSRQAAGSAPAFAEPAPCRLIRASKLVNGSVCGLPLPGRAMSWP
ncbi:FHA domain-containing protein, partial [Pseudomonas aeruginosa]